MAQEESYVEVFLWRLLCILLVKAVALLVVRFWHARNPCHIPPQKTMRYGLLLGIWSGVFLQAWNILEVIILAKTHQVVCLAFYSATIAFIYLTLEQTETTNPSMKGTARLAIVATTFVNLFLKTTVQKFATNRLL